MLGAATCRTGQLVMSNKTEFVLNAFVCCNKFNTYYLFNFCNRLRRQRPKATAPVFRRLRVCRR